MSAADYGPDLIECPECGELVVHEDFEPAPRHCECGACLPACDKECEET